MTKNIPIIFIVIYIFCSQPSQAINTLEQSKNSQETASLEALKDSMINYAKLGLLGKAFQINKVILSEALQLNDSERIAEAYLFFGKFSIDIDTNILMAKEYLDTALYYGLDDHWMTHTYILYQSIYEELNDFENIYKSHLQVMSFGEKLHRYQDMAKSLNMIGNIYYGRDNMKMAMPFYVKSNHYARLINDSALMATSLNNIGIVFMGTYQYDSAYNYISTALELNKSLGDYTKLSINYSNIGRILEEDSLYTQAFDCYQKALKYAKLSSEVYCIPIADKALGEYYRRKGDHEKALEYLFDALSYSEYDINYSSIKEITKSIIDIYFERNDIANIEKYYRMYSIANDSVSKNMRKSAVDFLKVETQNRHEKEKHIQFIENKKRELKLKMKLLIIIGLLVVTLLIIYIVYKQQKNKLYQAKLKQANLRLEKKLLNTELTDFSLQIIQRNKLLNELNTELKSLSGASVEEGKQIIKGLITTLSSTKQSRDELEILQEKMDKINTKFYYDLEKKHPDLTKNEIHLCALLRINLSIKDIATLKNISPKSVKMAKYRLRKKLKISSETVIANYLKDI